MSIARRALPPRVRAPILTTARRRRLAALFLIFLTCGCATKQPFLYPNARLEEGGQEAGRAAVEECGQRARDVQPEDIATRDATLDVAINTGAGAAAGAVSGAIWGRAGAGAAAGAVSGAVFSVVRAMFTRRMPDPVRARYTERCLAERGYEVAGWR